MWNLTMWESNKTTQYTKASKPERTWQLCPMTASPLTSTLLSFWHLPTLPPSLYSGWPELFIQRWSQFSQWPGMGMWEEEGTAYDFSIATPGILWYYSLVSGWDNISFTFEIARIYQIRCWLTFYSWTATFLQGTMTDCHTQAMR